jgi:NAD(P)H-dependent FMN reductase
MAIIALILGSVRRDRQGINVGLWLEKKVKTRDHIVHFIDPLTLDLPLLDRMYKEMNPPSSQNFTG